QADLEPGREPLEDVALGAAAEAVQTDQLERVGARLGLEPRGERALRDRSRRVVDIAEADCRAGVAKPRAQVTSLRHRFGRERAAGETRSDRSHGGDEA